MGVAPAVPAVGSPRTVARGAARGPADDAPPPATDADCAEHARRLAGGACCEHPGEILRGALLGYGPNAAFYAIAVFLASFLATEKILPEQSALSLETASIAFMVVLTPLAGHLGDRLGRSRWS